MRPLYGRRPPPATAGVEVVDQLIGEIIISPKVMKTIVVPAGPR